MPIVYSVVARGTVILADYAARQGNFASLTKKLLEKIPASNGRQTYTFESFVRPFNKQLCSESHLLASGETHHFFFRSSRSQIFTF
jgi:hypothetical protein